MYDLLICNAQLLDGSGQPAFRGDIAVEQGRIVAIGDLAVAEASRTIDAEGRIACPGFIDIHTHSDLTIALDGRALSSLTQGITTQVMGNCGVSAAPTRDYEPYYGPLDPAMTRGLACDWTHFGDYFQRLEANGLGTNTATLVGHGNVRVAAMGYDDRPPSAAEMEQMKALVARAMEDGAMGLSSGLAYAPGPYAALEELVELGKVVAEYGGIYTSHIRNQTESIAQAVGEVIAVGEQASVAAHVSHMQPGAPMIGATRDLLATIDQKRREGCDISCDAIPYTIGSTTLKSLLPPWALAGGDEELLRRLQDPETRAKIEQDTVQYGAESGGSRKRNLARDGEWDKIWLGSAEQNADLVGLSFAEIGRRRGQTPTTRSATSSSKSARGRGCWPRTCLRRTSSTSPATPPAASSPTASHWHPKAPWPRASTIPAPTGPSPTSCATSSASKARCAGKRPSTSSLATPPPASACARAACCAKATGPTSWSSTLKPSASAPTLPIPTAIRRASTA